MPNNSVKLLHVYPPQIYGKTSSTCSIVFQHTDGYCGVYNIGVPDPTCSQWRMIKVAGVWQPFEWVNPPMDLGVEYRTTERYLGKPVYVKMVDCGSLPNAGYKAVNIGTPGLEKVIEISGCAIDTKGDFYSIPATNFSSSVHDVGLYATGSQAIAISTQSDRSNYRAYVKVKYTKTIG